MTKEPKQETFQKLKTIATAIYNEWGIEAVDLDNLLQISVATGRKLGHNMAWKTYKDHLSKISGMIKQIEFENHMDKMPEYIGGNQLLSEEKEKVEQKKELLSIKFMYSDGSYEIRELKPQIIIQQPVIAQPPVIWTGLFDYKNDGSIIIQKGKYTGCNIKSRQSIMETFKSISWFYKWSLGQIAKAENGIIKIMPDTPRDVETLKKIVSKIETSMNC